ncbi:MAG: hypothetical protein RR885_03850, partial [Oscillospiraceae bacterium]
MPTNIAILSDATVIQHVNDLLNVLKGTEHIELLCLNSRKNFEGSKQSKMLHLHNCCELLKLGVRCDKIQRKALYLRKDYWHG